MQLSIMTPGGRILDRDEVAKVRICLDNGSWLSIYPRHAPIIAAVSPCELTYEDSDGVGSQLAIGAGVMRFEREILSIYVTASLSGESGTEAPDYDVQSIARLTEQLLAVLD